MKTKLQVVPAPTPVLTSDQKRKIDRYGEVDRLLQLFEPIAVEHKALKDEISAWPEGPADRMAILDGNFYRVQASARRKERTVSNARKLWAAMKAALGAEALQAAVTIPLGLIDKHVPESVQAEFLTTEQSGSRTLEVVALHEANQAALQPAA